MDTPWISAYEPKKWTLHEVPLQSDNWTALKESVEKNSQVQVFAAESPMAVDWWKKNGSVKGLLFYDLEQLWQMELDDVYGVNHAGRLTKNWKEHTAGSFVMILCKGVTNDPPFFTVAVTTSTI